MIEAYKIATNMTITGDANKKILEFSKNIEKAYKSTDKMLRSILTLNQFLKDTRNHLQSINPALKIFDRSMSSIATDMRRTNGSMSFFNDMLVKSSANTQQLRYQTNTLRNSMLSLSAAGRQASANIGNIRNRRTGGGGGGRGAIAGGGIMALASDYIVPSAIAYGAYGAGKESFNKYAQYTSALAITKGMGYDQSVVDQVQRSTEEGKPGLSPLTQINSYNAALMATQSPTKAASIYPTIAKAMTTSPSIFGGMGKHQLEEAVRGAEILAGGDENKLVSAFSDILGMMFTSGGTLKPSDIRHIIRKNSSLSRLGLMELEPAAQELGGEKLSTGLQTGRMALAKGQMGKYQALEWHRLGILGAPELDKNGRPIGSKFGNMSKANWELYNSNPTEFLQQVLLPAFKKVGLTQSSDILQEMTNLLPNTTGTIFQTIYKNLLKSNSIRNRQSRIPGIEGEAAINPAEAQSLKRTSEAWDTFSVALGKATAPAITTGLNIISNFLEKFSKLLNISSKPEEIEQNNNNLRNYFSPGLITDTGSANSKAPTIQGHVYLNSDKVGNWFGKVMLPSTLQDHGTNAANVPYNGIPVSYGGNTGTHSQ